MRSDFTEASIAINRALSLDPNSAEAHATRGFIDTFYRWDWKEAEDELNRSIELNPGYGSAHQWLGILFEIQGRNADGIRELQRAVEIDPSSPNFEADLGQAYYFDHRYDEAKAHCRAALDLDPEFIFAHAYLEHIDMVTGEYGQAIDEWKILATLADDYPTQSGPQKQQNVQRFETLAANFKNSTDAFFNALIDANTRTPDICYGNARIYALLGDKEKALADLDCTIGNKNFGVVFVRADPVFDGLRDDPRFKEIMKKMNLPA
jgi:tetratricopeptide (TPR) repeat protein